MFSNLPQRQLSFRYFVLLLFSSFLFSNSFAQTSWLSKQSSAISWQLDATVSGVKFYHSLTECNGRKAIFLKFDNTNAYKVQVSWKEVFATQYEPQVEGFSGQKNLVLGVGETAATDCANPTQKKLLILPEQITPTYVADVSKFDYKAIAVSKVK